MAVVKALQPCAEIHDDPVFAADCKVCGWTQRELVKRSFDEHMAWWESLGADRRRDRCREDV